MTSSVARFSFGIWSGFKVTSAISHIPPHSLYRAFLRSKGLECHLGLENYKVSQTRPSPWQPREPVTETSSVPRLRTPYDTFFSNINLDRLPAPQFHKISHGKPRTQTSQEKARMSTNAGLPPHRAARCCHYVTGACALQFTTTPPHYCLETEG